MREITSDEVPELLDCIKALSQYHNEISNNYFKGYYPIRDYNTTLEFLQNH